MSERKVVCIQYETGKTVKRNGKTYPGTRLLNVGSAFLTEEEGRWRISGQFRAIPPQWDGRFVLLDPLPRESDEPEGGDDDIPF